MTYLGQKTADILASEHMKQIEKLSSGPWYSIEVELKIKKN